MLLLLVYLFVEIVNRGGLCALIEWPALAWWRLCWWTAVPVSVREIVSCSRTVPWVQYLKEWKKNYELIQLQMWFSGVNCQGLLGLHQFSDLLTNWSPNNTCTCQGCVLKVLLQGWYPPQNTSGPLGPSQMFIFSHLCICFTNRRMLINSHHSTFIKGIFSNSNDIFMTWIRRYEQQQKKSYFQNVSWFQFYIKQVICMIMCIGTAP